MDMPFMDCPFMDCPFMDCPFIDCPFMDLPFIDIPFIDWPFIDCPFMDIPFIDSPIIPSSCELFISILIHTKIFSERYIFEAEYPLKIGPLLVAQDESTPLFHRLSPQNASMKSYYRKYVLPYAPISSNIPP
jgi:hypothetical protein